MRRLVLAMLVPYTFMCVDITIAQYLSSCYTPDGDGGTCVLVRECPFVRSVLKKQTHSNNDIRYVAAIRCGILDTKALVCCNGPNVTQTAKPVDAETIAGLVENRFSTREEKQELLPAVCGKDNYRGPLRGERAILFHHPWNMLIQHRTKEGDTGFHCGGALINDRYILTAARCIMGVKKTWTVDSVRVGEWNLESDPDCNVERGDNVECADSPQDVAIEKISIHSNYTGTDTPEVKNDIALIRLARKVPISSSVAPICLPLDSALRQEVDLEKAQFLESGWGIAPDANGSNFKMNFYTVGVSRGACRRQYPHAGIDAGHVCATPQRGVDTCRGDTGGPLMYRHINGTYLMGVASFRKQCAITGEPAVYTNVAEHVDWIVDTIEP